MEFMQKRNGFSTLALTVSADQLPQNPKTPNVSHVNFLINSNKQLLKMPPKKSKKGKKGKKGKEEPEPEDHYMTMKGEQLQITIENLKEKLQDAKIKRNML